MARESRVTYPTMDAQRSDTFKAFDVTTLRGEEKRKRRGESQNSERNERAYPLESCDAWVGAFYFFLFSRTCCPRALARGLRWPAC